MIRTVIILSALIGLAACGGKEVAPLTDTSDAFTIISSTPEQATKSITINIRIEGPLSQDSARNAAETIIARHRDSYRNITVRSFAQGSRETDLPYATSVLQNGVINHKFNPMVAPQKIPTH